MPNPRIYFRVNKETAKDLMVLATRFHTTPGHIAKLIVVRDISQIPTLLERQEQALQEMRQFHRDLAAALEEYLEGIADKNEDFGLHSIVSILNAQSKAIDAIRAACLPPSSSLPPL
jgi:hypothetical protein